MKMRYIILAAVLITGCNNSNLELSDNTASNVAALASCVPAGTDSALAVTLMSDAGFTCRLERNKTTTLPKGTNTVGQVGPMDFIWYDKQRGTPVARRWQVILILNGQKRVKDHSITTGLVGP